MNDWYNTTIQNAPIQTEKFPAIVIYPSFPTVLIVHAY